MKVQVTPTAVLTIAGLIAAGFLVWKVSRAGAVAAEVAAEIIAKDLNPASRENLAYRGINAVGASVSGNENWSLGGWAYEVTHTDQKDPTRNTIFDGLLEWWGGPREQRLSAQNTESAGDESPTYSDPMTGWTP